MGASHTFSASRRHLDHSAEVAIYLLVSAGMSYRAVGRLFGRSDKTISAAAARVAADGPRLSTEQRKILARFEGFAEWVNAGKSRGYFELLGGNHA